MILTDPLYLILIALVLTLVIELVVAFVLGFRKREEILAIVAVNLITNPALNLFIQLAAYLELFQFSMQILIPLEALVVVAEFLLLSIMLKQKKVKLFSLSLAINTTSFLIGLAITGIWV